MSLIDTEIKSICNKLPKPKGAYGRRHFSRGMCGFYDKAKSKRRPVVEYAGYALVDKLVEMGELEEAAKLLDQLTE